jgi:hypothetical protein
MENSLTELPGPPCKSVELTSSSDEAGSILLTCSGHTSSKDEACPFITRHTSSEDEACRFEFIYCWGPQPRPQRCHTAISIQSLDLGRVLEGEVVIRRGIGTWVKDPPPLLLISRKSFKRWNICGPLFKAFHSLNFLFNEIPFLTYTLSTSSNVSFNSTFNKHNYKLCYI